MKKYKVYIEQPMLKEVEVEAKSIEEAMDMVSEEFNSGALLDRLGWYTCDDIGTGAQIMAEAADEDDTERTEWCDL